MVLNTSMSIIRGTVLGATAYILGMLVTAVAAYSGLHEGLAFGTAFFGFYAILIGHISIHDIGLLSGNVEPSLLPLTALTILIVILAGYFAGLGDGGVGGGASIAIGYAMMNLLVILFIIGSLGGTTWGFDGPLRNLFFVGIVFPALFGSLGGSLAR